MTKELEDDYILLSI